MFESDRGLPAHHKIIDLHMVYNTAECDGTDE